MSTGVWEPRKQVALTQEKLQSYVALVRAADLDDLAASVSADLIRQDAGVMQLAAEAWQLAEALADDEIEALIQFFTLVEMQFPGWEGGKQSPVIALVKILKARDAFAPELRKWIKANTDNRYLPNGSIL